MESAQQGNICLRVVSPDRPMKGSVSVAADPHGSCVYGGKTFGKECFSRATAPTGHRQVCSSTRRNSSIGLLLAGNSQDPSSQEKGTLLLSDYRVKEQRPSRQSAARSVKADGRAPSYRPLVGSGAAAAYEALRHDFYVQKQKSQRRMSSLSCGSAWVNEAEAREPEFREPITNQSGGVAGDDQFEMLRLHYFNLVNEIQETAMMLNVCEQHQLKLQQEIENGQAPGGPEPSSRPKRPLPTDGSFEILVPTKIVKL